jgi:chemotaxis protein MotB
MKRFAGTGVKVGLVMLAAVVLGGCVSQGKYDELKFAQRNCEAERERLTAELAGAQNTIRTMDQEIKRLKDLLAEREAFINALKDRLEKAGIAIDKLTNVYDKLANQRIPTGGLLQAPLPPALNQALIDFAKKYPNMIEYDPARGVLKFKSDLLFDLGSAKVKEEAVAPLQEFAKILGIPEAANFDAVVVGHTDNIPIGKPGTRQAHPTNWHLSVHRSISVMEVLRDAGVNSERIGVMGYGEYRPVAQNTSAENRAKNRRVEIYIVPKQAIGERDVKSTTGAPQQQQAPAAQAPEETGEEKPAVEK